MQWRSVAALTVACSVAVAVACARADEPARTVGETPLSDWAERFGAPPVDAGAVDAEGGRGATTDATPEAGPEPFRCRPDDPWLHPCDACLERHCCDAWRGCGGRCLTEYTCFERCAREMSRWPRMSAQQVLRGCARSCATDNDVLSVEAHAAVRCAVRSCRPECFGRLPDGPE